MLVALLFFVQIMLKLCSFFHVMPSFYLFFPLKNCYILQLKFVTFRVKKLLHFALKVVTVRITFSDCNILRHFTFLGCYILRQILLHFALMLHFAA